jgi:hypothetical protein
MITFQELVSRIWAKKDKPIKGNTYFTRILVRIDGKDYDISDITLNEDGVLGEYFVIHTTPLVV